VRNSDKSHWAANKFFHPWSIFWLEEILHNANNAVLLKVPGGRRSWIHLADFQQSAFFNHFQTVFLCSGTPNAFDKSVNISKIMTQAVPQFSSWLLHHVALSLSPLPKLWLWFQTILLLPLLQWQILITDRLTRTPYRKHLNYTLRNLGFPKSLDEARPTSHFVRFRCTSLWLVSAEPPSTHKTSYVSTWFAQLSLVTIEIWAKARAIQATDDLGVKFKPTRTLQTVSASPLTFHRISHPVSWTSAFENETSIRTSQPLVVLGSHTKDAAAEDCSLHEEIKHNSRRFS